MKQQICLNFILLFATHSCARETAIFEQSTVGGRRFDVVAERPHGFHHREERMCVEASNIVVVTFGMIIGMIIGAAVVRSMQKKENRKKRKENSYKDDTKKAQK